MSWFVVIFSGYVFICWVFFKFPSLLHNKKQQIYKRNKKYTKWLNAHRGGSAEKPENTLDAFKNSYSQGFDILELDVVPSKDGVIIVSHDNSIHRITGKHQLITDLNYSELPYYSQSFESHFLPDCCSFDDKDYKFTTLEDVFLNFPDVIISVDIKVLTPVSLSSTKALIEKHNRAHLTVFIT